MSRPRFLITFVIFGCSAMTVQVLILRELLVVLAGNELCVGIALGSWLIGIVVGAGMAALFLNWINPRLIFGLSVAVHPILATGAVVAIRMSRSLLGIPLGEQIPPGVSLVSSLVCVAPLGVLVGFAFPLAVVAYRRFKLMTLGAHSGEPSSCTDGKSATPASATVSVVYALESIGGLAAGGLLSLCLVGHFETIRILVWMAVLTGFVAHILTADSRAGWRMLIWTVVVLLVATSGGARAIETWSNQRRWMGIASGDLMDSVETPYQHLDLGRISSQYNLYGNGSFLFSFPDPYAEELDAHLWMSLHPKPRSVLLIGGRGGRYIPPLLEHHLDRIDYVELDAAVISVVRRRSGQKLRDALSAKNVHVHTTDGRRFLRQTKEKYDVVVVNLPDPSTALLNRFYTREFYEEIRRALTSNGILVTEVEASNRYLAGEVGAYAASVNWTLSDVFMNVGILPDGTITFFASQAALPPLDEPNVLVQRLKAQGISSESFTPEAILVKILPLRAKSVRESLETFRAIPRNSDVAPQSYLRRLILWGRESGSGSLSVALIWLDTHRHFLLLLFLLAASVPWIFLGMAPKQASLTACVSAVGCAGMGLELVAVYMYQDLYGFLYQEIGLLIAVFMAGLAVGAPLGQRFVRNSRAPSVLLKLLFATIFFTLLFPGVLWLVAKANLTHAAGVTLYGALILMTGILVGAVFPVAVAVLATEPERTAGRSVAAIDAADHLGGVLGAFLPGVVFFPLFGILWTCVWLAVGLASVALGFLLAVYLEGS